MDECTTLTTPCSLAPIPACSGLLSSESSCLVVGEVLHLRGENLGWWKGFLATTLWR